jgi:hypothetical protein
MSIEAISGAVTFHANNQGTLTEGKGLVHLTSCIRLPDLLKEKTLYF